MIGTPQKQPITDTIPIFATIVPMPIAAEVDEVRRLKLRSVQWVKPAQDVLRSQFVDESGEDVAHAVLIRLAPFVPDCRISRTLEPYPADLVTAYDGLRETYDHYIAQEESVCRHRTLPNVEQALLYLADALNAFQRWVESEQSEFVPYRRTA